MKKTLALIVAALLLIPSVSYAVQGYARHGNNTSVTLTNSGQEYSVTIPNDVGGIDLQSRTAADFKLAFTSNQSGSNFWTVKSGTVFTRNPLNLGQANISPYTTIYFQSATAGQVVEVIYWY
jgi:hypothetical protein